MRWRLAVASIAAAAADDARVGRLLGRLVVASLAAAATADDAWIDARLDSGDLPSHAACVILDGAPPRGADALGTGAERADLVFFADPSPYAEGRENRRKRTSPLADAGASAPAPATTAATR